MINIDFHPNSELKQWDNIEIHPCKVYKENDKEFWEQCEENEAQFYSVYIHLIDGGLQCIADFTTKELAERFARTLRTLTMSVKN